MTTTATSAALIPVAPVFTNTEQPARAGFLAGYSGLARQAYELDLRQYANCHQHHIRLFQARRPDIECFARDLETRGHAIPRGYGSGSGQDVMTVDEPAAMSWLVCPD